MRRNLRQGNEQAAIHDALLAGLHANDAAANAHIAAPRKSGWEKGGLAKGEQETTKAAKNTAAIRTHEKNFNMSEEEIEGSRDSYVSRKTHLSKKTISRRRAIT